MGVRPRRSWRRAIRRRTRTDRTPWPPARGQTTRGTSPRSLRARASLSSSASAAQFPAGGRVTYGRGTTRTHPRPWSSAALLALAGMRAAVPRSWAPSSAALSAQSHLFTASVAERSSQGRAKEQCWVRITGAVVVARREEVLSVRICGPFPTLRLSTAQTAKTWRWAIPSQIPPLRHGFGAHSSMSTAQFTPVKP